MAASDPYTHAMEEDVVDVDDLVPFTQEIASSFLEGELFPLKDETLTATQGFVNRFMTHVFTPVVLALAGSFDSVRRRMDCQDEEFAKITSAAKGPSIAETFGAPTPPVTAAWPERCLRHCFLEDETPDQAARRHLDEFQRRFSPHPQDTRAELLAFHLHAFLHRFDEWFATRVPAPVWPEAHRDYITILTSLFNEILRPKIRDRLLRVAAEQAPASPKPLQDALWRAVGLSPTFGTKRYFEMLNKLQCTVSIHYTSNSKEFHNLLHNVRDLQLLSSLGSKEIERDIRDAFVRGISPKESSIRRHLEDFIRPQTDAPPRSLEDCINEFKTQLHVHPKWRVIPPPLSDIPNDLVSVSRAPIYELRRDNLARPGQPVHEGQLCTICYTADPNVLLWSKHTDPWCPRMLGTYQQGNPRCNPGPARGLEEWFNECRAFHRIRDPRTPSSGGPRANTKRPRQFSPQQQQASGRESPRFSNNSSGTITAVVTCCSSSTQHKET